MALGAFALDVAVGQEHALDRVVELLDGAGLDQVLRLERAVDVLRQRHVLGRVGGVPVVETDVEAVQVLRALGGVARHQRPVSYTHLDVYKRQEQMGGSTMSIAGRGELAIKVMAPPEAVVRAWQQLLMAYLPVALLCGALLALGAYRLQANRQSFKEQLRRAMAADEFHVCLLYTSDVYKRQCPGVRGGCR